MESCDYEPPQPAADCPHCDCQAGPVSFTIQIGDDPPTFHVNTGRLEEAIRRAEQS